jgi:zinc protease
MRSNKVLKKIPVFFAVITLCWFWAATAEAQTGPPKQEKLLNGLKVLMWSDPKADRVSVKVRIHSGSAFDPQGKEGVMHLLGDSLFPSEAARDFFVEDLGGSLEVITKYDYIQVNASSKPENFLTMLETVATAVSDPQINKEVTAQIKSSLLKRLRELEADPTYFADITAAKRLFGTFPYGRPQLGSTDSVKKIDFADLIDARQRFLTADNATVVIIGNFDRTLGFRAIRRYFGNWLKSDRRVPSTFKQPDDPPPALLVVASPQPKAAAVRFAFRGPARSDKDLAASLVFASIIENRLRARVPEAHNEDVFVRSHAHFLPGSIVIGFSAGENEVGTGHGKVEANELVIKALSDAITEAEFTTAIRAVQAEWSKRDLASFWLDAETYKIASPQADIRSVATVTLSDVRSYAERARTRPIASVLVNTPPKSK